MATQKTFADGLFGKESVDPLTQWVRKQGRNPWIPGFFKGSNPLENLLVHYEDFCKSRKFKLGSTSAHAAWGMYIALQDSVAQIQTLEFKLEDVEGKLTSQIESLEQKAAERETCIESLQKENERLGHEKLESMSDKRRYIKELEEKGLQLAEALRAAEAAQKRVEELTILHSQAQSAAQFLAKEQNINLKAVSHEACKREIEGLKQKLGLQTALIATVHPESLPSLTSLSVPDSLPAEIRHSPPINPEWEQSVPVCPVVTETVTKTNARGNIETQEIAKVMAWKPHEAQAIASQLGPLTPDKGVQWLATTLERHPTARGEDLCQLLRLCVTGPDAQSIEMGVCDRGLEQFNGLRWAREVAKLLWPGTNPEFLFLSLKQAPGENPEGYSRKKCFLAKMAEKVPRIQGDYDFDIDDFKVPYYHGLNAQTRMTIGMLDPTDTAWRRLKEKVRLAADLFHETPSADAGGTKQSRKTAPGPIQAVTYANTGPHSTHQWNEGSDRQNRDSGQRWNGNRGGYRGRGQSGSERRQGGQDRGSFRGGQNDSQSQPVKGKADQLTPSAPVNTREAASSDFSDPIRQQTWATLRSLGEDMRRYDRQPTQILVEAVGRLVREREKPSPKPVSVLQERQPSEQIYPSLQALGGAE